MRYCSISYDIIIVNSQKEGVPKQTVSVFLFLIHLRFFIPSFTPTYTVEKYKVFLKGRALSLAILLQSWF